MYLVFVTAFSQGHDGHPDLLASQHTHSTLLPMFPLDISNCSHPTQVSPSFQQEMTHLHPMQVCHKHREGLTLLSIPLQV